MKAPVSPEFLAAGREYRRLFEAGLSQTREGHDAFRRMYDAAPESFHREMHDMAVQLGLMPAIPDDYTDDGQPVYSLEAMAKRLGIDEEEALRVAKELGIELDTAQVNRVN